MVSTVQVSTVDLEPAIKELAQGYDLTVRLHCILLAQKTEGRSATLDLVEKILQAFKSSLAVLKPHTSSYTRFEIKEAAASKSNNKNGFSGDNNGEDGAAEHSRKRKGINEKSFKTVTSTPHHDGYQWRKYGEKKIRGTIYPRCYYRCTYLHDQHCQAIKQIQQLNSDDPPLYEVTYNRNHTCANGSSLKRNGEDLQSKDGFPTCISFAENEDDDDVTIVSSSGTNSKEIDPAGLRQPNQIQDASKRAKTNALTLGMGPTQSTPTLSSVSTVGPAPPAVSVKSPVVPTSTDDIMDPAFMWRLNQEATKKQRDTLVISPTPLSVAGPTLFSVVGPSQFSSLPPVQPGLDPALLRHLNQAEAAKGLRTSLSFNKPSRGPAPSEHNTYNNNNNNVGTSFPPFTFLTSRFEKIMSQNNQSNNNSIESLFTLPSERPLNTNLNNPNLNRAEGNRLEGRFSLSAMERSNARVRRSLSDNGNQMEGISHSSFMERNLVERSLSQNQMESVFARNVANHNNNANRRSKQMEGVFTLSSMEISANANVANPNNGRENRSLSEKEKQMESLSHSSMEKSSDTNSANLNSANLNSANPNENGLNRNLSENQANSTERNSEKKIENPSTIELKENLSQNQNWTEGLAPDTNLANPNPSPNLNSNKVDKILSIKQTQLEGALDPAPMESSSDPKMANPNSTGEDRPNEMEAALTLSSMERMPNSNLKENRVEKNVSENHGEMEGFLSLSSTKRSTSNPKSQNQSAMEGVLSLSLMDKSHSTGEDGSSSQKTSQMEGILSLSSMERSSDPQPVLELNLPFTSPLLPQPPPLPLPPPQSPPPLPPPPPPEENPKSNEEVSQLEATVTKLRTKLDKSKEEEISTKQKVSNLEAEISTIKAANEAWQRMMADEARRRVAEAVSQLASSLTSSGNLPEGSRRTEILFPGAVDEDDSVVEVPSLLSQLDKND